ncbi:MAG: hypothetical protein GEU73_14320 [Chloroflexi bacterium]|nr:hypothetical protein [Chloroflexota bacterium]
MPVPFQNVDDIEELGPAGFLKVERSADGAMYRGALFQINGRGEPLEFTYNRLEVPRPLFWRRTDLRRHAERRLISSLLAMCKCEPRLLLCLADEVGSALFSQDLRMAVPAARIGRPVSAAARINEETGEILEESEPPNLSWIPGPPPEGSRDRRLLDRLSRYGLLLEPFDRAAIGLREAYASDSRKATSVSSRSPRTV